MRDDTRPVEDEMVKWAMSDVAPMSDEAFGRGRAALLARMDADSADEGGPAAEAGPAGSGGPARKPELSGKAEPAGDAGTAGPARKVVVPLAPRRRRRIPLVAAAAVMVVIAGAALVAPSLVSRHKGPSMGSAAAAEVLKQAALSAGDAVVPPGQYLYVLQYARWSSSDNEYRWMYLEDQTLETWIPADRKATWLHRRTNTGNKQWLLGSEKDVPGHLPPPREDLEWKAEGGAWLGDGAPVSFRNPAPEYIAALPRDPRALYEKLRGEASGKEDRSLLLMVTDGLDSGMYPADVRSAIFKALAYLPGLEIADRTAVLDSRQGTALGITEGDTTTQIVVNPETGDYLGSRTVQARDAHSLKAGTVLGITAITTRVVSAMGAPY